MGGGGGGSGVGGLDGELAGVVVYVCIAAVDDFEGVVAACGEGGRGRPEVGACVFYRSCLDHCQQAGTLICLRILNHRYASDLTRAWGSGL